MSSYWAIKGLTAYRVMGLMAALSVAAGLLDMPEHGHIFHVEHTTVFDGGPGHRVRVSDGRRGRASWGP